MTHVHAYFFNSWQKCKSLAYMGTKEEKTVKIKTGTQTKKTWSAIKI